MGHKDVVSKSIIKRLVKDIALHLLDQVVEVVDILNTEQQRIEERRADLVARVRNAVGDDFILHIEIQNDNHTQMALRMLRYYVDIQAVYPHDLIQQYVIYIGKNNLTMQDHIQHPDWRYQYHLLDIKHFDCELFLQQDSPDAWVLAVLCDFQGKSSREVVHCIIQQLQQHTGNDPGNDPSELRRYIQMLEVLATNRDLKLNIQEELEMLNIELEQLPTYQLGMKQGEAQGKLEGDLNAKLTMAQKLLATGMMTDHQVAEITALSLEQIRALSR